MSRVKQKALSGPPSQEPLEGGPDSALPFISNTVAALTLHLACAASAARPWPAAPRE
jgi:hypothetical protein